MIKYIVDLQLFPCVEYCRTLVKSKYVEFEQYENFQKSSFRNRLVIPSANGLVTLTIPLIGGREQKVSIRQVKIDHSIDWASQHWKTVKSCFMRSPFFDYYEQELETLFFDKSTFLFDFNLKILNWVLEKLKLDIAITLTDSYIYQYDEGVIDDRNCWLPKNYQTTSAIKYSQVFEDRIGFQPNVSVLDLILNEGPNARNILIGQPSVF